MKNWIDKDRELLLWRQQLRPFLDKWRGLTRNKDSALLQGVYLAEARRWLRDRDEDLNAEERQFIEASERPTIRLQRVKQLTAAVIVLGVFAYLAWTRRDDYQVQAVFKASPTLVSYAGRYSAESWVKMLARLGRTREALTDGLRVADPGDRAFALAALAEVLSENGKSKSQESVEAATGALEALGSEQPNLQVFISPTVAQALVGVEKTQEALAATLKFTNENSQAQSFEGMAKVLYIRA